MATRKKANQKENWGAGVQYRNLRLASVSFKATPDAVWDEDQDVTADLILNVTRLAVEEVVVEFGVELQGIEGVTARCTFRAQFRLRSGSPEEQQPEVALKGVATRVAPVLLYPFVREVLQTAAARAALPDFALPIVNFSDYFKEFELPAFEEDEG